VSAAVGGQQHNGINPPTSTTGVGVNIQVHQHFHVTLFRI
jgi:hypothetical protein